jgi:hypothetical protein
VRWTEHIAGMKKNRDKHRPLVGNLEGERPLGRPRCRYVENINGILEICNGIICKD